MDSSVTDIGVDRIQNAYHAVTVAMVSLKKELDLRAQTIEAGSDLKQTMRFYHEMTEGYDALDKQRKEIYALLDRLEKGVIPGKFEVVGDDTIVRIPEIGRSFYIVRKSSATMPNKELAYAWLRENGGEELIVETVNSGTLSAFLKEKLKEEGVEPDEEENGIRISSYSTIGSSKYTPK